MSRSSVGGAAALRVDSLGKSYDDVRALDELTLDVEAGSFTALVGPSGCGKSTLLSIVAGLLEPDRGDVLLDGESLQATPAQRRPVSLVFQKPLLFPQLSVAQNVGFGLRMRRLPRAEIRARVEGMLDRVQLSALSGRRVDELSGGQEQRVSLARALVLRPRVLLLDEPFSQLDAALRVEMRALVRQLHESTALTTIFVTHDQAEAVDVADDIALLLDGQLAGHGPPALFYRDPPSLAAARFFGVGNELDGVVSDGMFRTPGGFAIAAVHPNGPAVLVIRPEAVQLVQAGGPDTLRGQFTGARFAGTHVALHIETADGAIRAHAPVGSTVDLGAQVHVRLPASACTVLPAGGR